MWGRPCPALGADRHNPRLLPAGPEAAEGRPPGLALRKRDDMQTEIHVDMEHCSAVKKRNLVIGNRMVREIRQTEEDKCRVISLVCGV